jgi:hypothetical protein
MSGINRWTIGSGLVIWALCGAVMGIGQATTTTDNALIIHAVAAPFIVLAVSLLYFRSFGTGHVGLTAVVFTAVPLAMDFFLVALVLLRSLEMFGSPLGTWIPFALIFAVTYVTGRAMAARPAAIRV